MSATSTSSEPLAPARAPLAVLLGVFTALSLPFLTKAFHIDDTLFVFAARHIRHHPADFYGFDVNWYGTLEPMYGVTRNPPLVCYYLAGVIALFGESELAFHLALLVPALASVAAMYFLARRLCDDAPFATALAVFTPAFFVSSTTVMCDVAMLCFWLFALLTWLRGLQSGRLGWLILSGVLLALAGLTKYYGLALVPLLGLYTLWKDRRMGAWVIALLVPLLFTLGFELLTHHLYGQRLLAAAAGYATRDRLVRGSVFAKSLIGLSFLGGSCLPAFFVAPWLWDRRALAAAVLGIAALTALLEKTHVLNQAGATGYAAGPWVALQVAIHAALGLSVLLLALLDVLAKRDARAALLSAWVIGTFVFATFLNWTTNVRSVLPLVPAFALLAARRVTAREGKGPFLSPWMARAALTISALIAFAVAWADMSLAESARTAARELSAAQSNAYFEGHWGFQYYAEKEGLRALDRRRDALRSGDFVIVPRNNTNEFLLPERLVHLRGTPSWPVVTSMSTMDPAVGAGFYSTVWGPLPFAFGNVAPDAYDIFEVHLPGK